jgi:hypothetical protein
MNRVDNREMELKDLTKALEHERRLTDATDWLMAVALGDVDILRQLEARRKSAVGGIGTADTTGLADILQPVVKVVSQFSVPGQLLRNFGALPAEPFVPIPNPSDDLESAGAWLAEGGGVPLARMEFAPVRLAANKFGLMIAFLRDLLRIGDAKAQNLVLRHVTRRIRRIEDAAFLSDSAASASTPAGILNGISSSGSGSPALLDDGLSAMVESVSGGEPQNPVFIADAPTIAELASSNSTAFKDVGLVGGRVLGSPLLVGPTGGRLVLIDATQVAVWPGRLEQEASQEAAVQFDDSPTNNSVTPTATNVVSAFQANAVVVRCLRWTTWQRLRDDAVAFIDV